MFGWLSRKQEPVKDTRLFSQYMSDGLPAKLVMPDELLCLFGWIEKQEFIYTKSDKYFSNKKTIRVGGLVHPDQYGQRDLSGSAVSFEKIGIDEIAQYWFKSTNNEIFERLFPFCKTCDEGSMAALWLNDNGQTQIVHMGSGSGSTWVGLIGKTPLDFLRFLAIPYLEHCWPNQFDIQPAEAQTDLVVIPNIQYQNWLLETFSTDIPQTAGEIIKIRPRMGDTDYGADAFSKWADRMLE